MFKQTDNIRDEDLESLIEELNLITFGRFRHFFYNTICRCCNLQKRWKPMLMANIKLLTNSHEQLNGGTISERLGESVSVGGVSFSTTSANEINKYYGTTKSNTLLPGLVALVINTGLTYPQSRRANEDVCGCCAKCNDCESECC